MLYTSLKMSIKTIYISMVYDQFMHGKKWLHIKLLNMFRVSMLQYLLQKELFGLNIVDDQEF